jgi:hypothetical protein
MLYHERQRWAHCGVHAMNNLLQQAKFNANDFEKICQELAPASDAAASSWQIIPRLRVNPHCSRLGLGNYDANVIMVILERQGFQVQWLDNREALTRQVLEEYYYNGTTGNNNGTFVETTFGIVVNKPSSSLLAKFTRGRHWLTLLLLRQNDDDQQQQQQPQWVNLDSELQAPQIIGDAAACVQLLQEWKTEQDCHIWLVKKKKSMKTPDDKKQG